MFSRSCVDDSRSIVRTVPLCWSSGGRMSDSIIVEERRRALRVPVRGGAVLYGSSGPLHGMIENLSQTGALVSVASRPVEDELDIELRLAEGGGWVVARIVRAQPGAMGWRIAV